MKNTDSLITKVTITTVLLASNISIATFLYSNICSLELFLKNIHYFVYDAIYGFMLPFLVINSILLWIYIASSGILLVDDYSILKDIAKPINRFTYKWGVEIAFYIFTFSIPSLVGGFIVIEIF